MDSQNNERRNIRRILKVIGMKIVAWYTKANYNEYPIFNDDGNVLGFEIFTALGVRSVWWTKDNELQ